jgi:anti-sigma28 factor (negative regulator of flagellin synthesis)
MQSKHQAPRSQDVRTELVERIRQEIAAGIYETPEKWAVALERLQEQLEEDDEAPGPW